MQDFVISGGPNETSESAWKSRILIIEKERGKIFPCWSFSSYSFPINKKERSEGLLFSKSITLSKKSFGIIFLPEILQAESICIAPSKAFDLSSGGLRVDKLRRSYSRSRHVKPTGVELIVALVGWRT